MRDLLSPTTTGARGDRLLISMSGGKTSAFMAHQILTKFRDNWREIVVVFANTGQENEATLEFVKNCDEVFGFNTVWVEAAVHQEKGRGTTHRVVTFETASRMGEPFEDVIRKYGVSNTKHPHCTRELKQRPIEDYAASIGWGNDYVTAIGIRPDEQRRVSASASKFHIVYPLIDWFYADKQDVNDWWDSQPFNLYLEAHQGNCRWCWKKSFPKHARLLIEDPSAYEFPERMESIYGYVGPEKEPDEAFPRTFFRGNRSTQDLRALCAEMGGSKSAAAPDENSGCGESCELYPTDPHTIPLFEIKEVA